MPVKYVKMLCFLHENHHFDFLFYIICELQKTKVISLLSFILVSFILTDEGNKSFILHPSSFILYPSSVISNSENLGGVLAYFKKKQYLCKPNSTDYAA